MCSNIYKENVKNETGWGIIWRKKSHWDFVAVQDGELIGKIHFNNLKVNRTFWIKREIG